MGKEIIHIYILSASGNSWPEQQLDDGNIRVLFCYLPLFLFPDIGKSLSINNSSIYICLNLAVLQLRFNFQRYTIDMSLLRSVFR